MDITSPNLEDLLIALPAMFVIILLRVAFAILMFWVCTRLTRVAGSMAARLARRARPQDTEAFIRAVQRIVSVVGIVLSLSVALSILGVDINSLVTGLGLTSLALGFALKDTIEQSLTGVLILFQRPFKVGDVIEIDTVEGTVMDVAIRTTNIRTFDGLYVLIPNNRVYQAVIRNKTHYTTRRFEVALNIAFTSDLLRVQTVILEAVSLVPGVLRDPAPMVSFDNFDAATIRAIARYWIEPLATDALAIRTVIARDITDACMQAGIAIPASAAVLPPPEPLSPAPVPAPAATPHPKPLL